MKRDSETVSQGFITLYIWFTSLLLMLGKADCILPLNESDSTSSLCLPTLPSCHERRN